MERKVEVGTSTTRAKYADTGITVYPAPCSFKCKYCWGQDPIWQYRTQNIDPIKEAWKYATATKPQRIIVSCTTDPYQFIEQEKGLTREVLSILVLNSKVTHQIYILTKNPQLAVNRDLDLLRFSNVWLGTTLTSMLELNKVRIHEPNAPTNHERRDALIEAHHKGVNTWVNIEPWIPDITSPLDIIHWTYEFVDWYMIGRLTNVKKYGYPEIPTNYYANETKRVIQLLTNLGFSPSSSPCKKGFRIRKGLLEEVNAK